MEMKVEKKTESFYIIGYLLELIIKIWQSELLLLLKSGKFEPIFPWKTLCIDQNHIFKVKISQSFSPRPKKKKHCHHPLGGCIYFL
jgi:hypothetical protein